MRDDVAVIVAFLTDCFIKKEKLFQRLILGEANMRQSLGAGAANRLEAYHADDDKIIADINALDFEIGQKLDSAAELMGLERSSALRRILEAGGGQVSALSRAMASALTVMEEAMAQRASLVVGMSRELDELRTHIRELTVQDRLRSIIPE